MKQIINLLLRPFTATRQDQIEQFINSKNPKTHADVEYWLRYAETRGF